MNEKYKKYIADYFGKDANFWKEIYKSPEKSDIYYYQHVTHRKQIITNYLDGQDPDRALRILDVGSGSGGVAEDLLRRGHKVFCLDISLDMLKVAWGLRAEYGEQIKVVRGGGGRIALETRLFRRCYLHGPLPVS